MAWQTVGQRQGATASRDAPKPHALTPRGFPVRYPTSYENPSFSVDVQKHQKAQQAKARAIKYRQRGFRKLPPPPPRPVFVLPRRGNHSSPKRTGYRVQALHFGVLGRDESTFQSEYSPRLKDGHIEINEDARYLVITGEGFTSAAKTQLHFRLVVAFDSVESILFDKDTSQLLLTLQFAPSFESHTGPSIHEVARVTAFDQIHRKITPYASRYLLLALASSTVLTPLLAVLTTLPIPRPVQKELFLEHRTLHYYSDEALLTFRATLGTLPHPAYAFQLEGLLHETLVMPTEFGELFSAIAELDLVHGLATTERWLVEVRRLLELDQFRRTRREMMVDEGKVEIELPPFDLGVILSDARDAVLDSREHLDLIPETDPHHFLVRHVNVTPTGLRFSGPFVEASNSVVRKFPQAIPHLLRVSFTEEDGTRLQVGRWGVTKEFLTNHVYSILSQSLDVCGRFYQFLAYSQSSLRSHTAWMVSPFWLDEDDDMPVQYDADGEEIVTDMLDAEQIRAQLGDFRKLIYQPTLYGARLSQAFTSSRTAVSLRPDAIVSVPDIVELNKYDKVLTNHTDGAGTMSYGIQHLIWDTLNEGGPKRDRALPPPDVYQIRLGGHKGIIVLDSLGPNRLCLRPSMAKFKAAFDDLTDRSYALHIAESFNRPGRMHLNRPLVSALEDLGIKPSVFLTLQRTAIDQLMDERTTIVGSVRMLNRYMLGGGSRFQSLLSSFIKVNSLSPSILTDEPFLKALMDVAVSRVLRDIKWSAKIGLKGCWQVVGVPDQDDYLEPDEIYCHIRDEQGGCQMIVGRVAITRSPTLDAGDVRIVKAVGEVPPHLRISSLHNCVVLSTRGSRAVASTMGGGDLDGDTYQIITIPELIPEKEVEPRGHEGVPPHRLAKPCTIDDVAAFFASFIENDNVGLAAVSHLRIADESPQGGFDPRCKRLADVYSRAVDYQKTGVAVPLSEIPRLKGPRPDFLAAEEHANNAGKETYASKRALGQLFRAIPHHQVPLHPVPHDTSQDSTTPHFDRLRSHLLDQACDEFSFQPIELSPFILTTTSRIINSFCAELSLLAEVGNYPRRPGQALSEVEVFLGSIAAEVLRQRRGAKDAATSLKFQVERLVDSLEEIIGRDLSLGDQFSSAWACWDDALRRPESEFGVKSFRWICCALLFEIIEDIAQPDHGPTFRARQPLIPPTPKSTSSSSRAGTPSHSSTPVVGAPVLEDPRPPPRASASGTKNSRKKDRARQAEQTRAELARLQSLPETEEDGDGSGWEVKTVGAPRKDDDWSSVALPTEPTPPSTSTPAPIASGWSVPVRAGPTARGGGRGRAAGGPAWTAPGRGRGGSNVGASPASAWARPPSLSARPPPARPTQPSSQPAPVNGWITTARVSPAPVTAVPQQPQPIQVPPLAQVLTAAVVEEEEELGWDMPAPKQQAPNAAWWE